MARIRRARTLAAPPQAVWAVVGDPFALPRWWPRAARVEDVDDDAFTLVLMTPKGKPVRADYRVVESAAPRLRRWRQQVANTPFERILALSETEIVLEPDGDGTRVTVTLTQRMRGMARLGIVMVRSAGRRHLDAVLDGLEALVGR